MRSVRRRDAEYEYEFEFAFLTAANGRLTIAIPEKSKPGKKRRKPIKNRKTDATVSVGWKKSGIAEEEILRYNYIRNVHMVFTKGLFGLHGGVIASYRLLMPGVLCRAFMRLRFCRGV